MGSMRTLFRRRGARLGKAARWLDHRIVDWDLDLMAALRAILPDLALGLRPQPIPIPIRVRRRR